MSRRSLQPQIEEECPLTDSRENLRLAEVARALQEVSRTIAENLNLCCVLSEIVTRVVPLAEADWGAIYAYEPAFGLELGAMHCTSRIAAQKGERAEALALMSQVVKTHEMIHIADLRGPLPDHLMDDPLLVADVDRVRSLGAGALLVLPLCRGAELVGLFWLARVAPGRFDAGTLQLLGTFAAQSTVAIHNARLFDELRRYADALEIANKHKSEFLGRMSHELRTPLNAIIGFSEVLLDRYPSELSEERRRAFLTHIHRSGKHLLELVGDILDAPTKIQ